MKDAEEVRQPTRGGAAPSRASTTVSGQPHANGNVGASGTSDCARALRLSRQLRLRVKFSVDARGWLGAEVVVAYRRAIDGTITPQAVRVRSDAIDADLAGSSGIHARCRRYNNAYRSMHHLVERLASLIRRAPMPLLPGSAVAGARHELSRVKELIASRRATYMTNSLVSLEQLGGEIEFLERCETQLADLIDEVEAERAQGAGAADRRDATGPQPAAPHVARWPRWMPWRNGSS